MQTADLAGADRNYNRPYAAAMTATPSQRLSCTYGYSRHLAQYSDVAESLTLTIKRICRSLTVIAYETGSSAYCVGIRLHSFSPSAISVRSNKPSPNRFAQIRRTGFRFVKSIARNRKILNRFMFGLANRLLRPKNVAAVTLDACIGLYEYFTV